MTLALPPITLTAQQQEAINLAAAWYANPNSSSVFQLQGYAGTGKTSTVTALTQRLGVEDKTVYTALTGKAVAVLRSKGCDDARTIHSLIYMAKTVARERLHQLEADLANTPARERQTIKALTKAIYLEKKRLDNPTFALREVSDIQAASLVVVDEASMVDANTARDLASFNIKLLALGDPMQLAPIRSASSPLVGDNPNYLLTQLHRSAMNSAVTRIACAVRAATPTTPWYGVPGLDMDSGRDANIGLRQLLNYDQVLCGTNATRWRLIEAIRSLSGRTSPRPVQGDKIIFTCNNPTHDVFNGQQSHVVACHDADSSDQYDLEVLYDDGSTGVVTVWASGFTGFDGEKAATNDGRGDVAAATFAHACTVHKAQGSEWDRVLVVDESNVFTRGAIRDGVDAGLGDQGAHVRAHRLGQRWMYTAVTRAALQVTITGKRVVA